MPTTTETEQRSKNSRHTHSHVDMAKTLETAGDVYFETRRHMTSPALGFNSSRLALHMAEYIRLRDIPIDSVSSDALPVYHLEVAAHRALANLPNKTTAVEHLRRLMVQCLAMIGHVSDADPSVCTTAFAPRSMDEVYDLREKVKQLESQLGQSDVEFVVTPAELDDLKRQNSELEATVDKLRAQVADLGAENDALKAVAPKFRDLYCMADEAVELCKANPDADGNFAVGQLVCFRDKILDEVLAPLDKLDDEAKPRLAV